MKTTKIYIASSPKLQQDQHALAIFLEGVSKYLPNPDVFGYVISDIAEADICYFLIGDSFDGPLFSQMLEWHSYKEIHVLYKIATEDPDSKLERIRAFFREHFPSVQLQFYDRIETVQRDFLEFLQYKYRDEFESAIKGHEPDNLISLNDYQMPVPAPTPIVTYVPSVSSFTDIATTAFEEGVASAISPGLLSGISSLVRRIAKLFSRQEKVYSSVFAQAEMERDKHMFVLVYLHTLKETEELLSLAQEVHPDVERRDNIPLSCRLKRGDKVDVCLYIRGKQTLYNKKKSITWQGTKTKCVFDYLIPENLEEKELSSQIILLTNGVPIGEMWFVTKITNNPCTLNPEVFSKPFKKVFISYSHKDIKIVQHLAEGFRLLKLDYFFDRHNLKPGDVYPEKIQKYIQSADVFVLYWSQNAKESNYVTQEISWALPLAYPQVQPKSESTLTIYPISIEPRADFPKELQENYDYIEL